MSRRGPISMAPDSHNNNNNSATTNPGLPEAGAVHNGTAETRQPPPGEDAPDGVTSITSPLPSGILFKGKKHRKRVTFRDSNLCNIREIPPRSRAASSSGEEYEEDSDEEDESCSSDSDDDTDTDSDNDEKTKKPAKGASAAAAAAATKTAPATRQPLQHQPASASYKDKAVSVTRTTPAPAPASSIAAAAAAVPPPAGKVRPERAPIPWSSNSTSYTGAMGSYEVSHSPASKVVSIVSQITGVSSAATQAHLRHHRGSANGGGGGGGGSGGGGGGGGSAGRASPSPPKPASHPKSPSPVVRVVKKVKKITPTLDNVMTSQTVRSVQKLGAMSESLHKGGHNSHTTTSNNNNTNNHHHHHHNNAGKTSRKKRVLHRRQEGDSKRKTSASSRKGKDSSKLSTASSRSKVNGASPTPAKSANKSAANGLGNAARDSLSLPKLSADDTLLLQPPPRALQQLSVAKSTVYSLDGFIFPGDPAHDLAAGIKAVSVSPTPEDNSKRMKPHVPPATPFGSAAAVMANAKDRASSAPALSNVSASRRKRYYAWQMANNGTLLQGGQRESPCITPMWDSIQPLATPVTAKPAHDR